MGTAVGVGGAIVGSSGSGGGGVTAKNYFAAVNKNLVALSSGLTAVTLEDDDSQGTPGFALADTQHLQCSITGIYVVTVSTSVSITGVAASPVNTVRTQINMSSVADPNALANVIIFEQDALVDQSTTQVVTSTFTTAPLAFASGDKFFLFCGLASAPAAGVTLDLRAAEDLTVATVRIG